MTIERSAKELALERLFDLSVDMLCVADLDGYFQYINNAFEKILGFSREELKKVPFIEFVHPEDKDSTLAALEQLTRGDPVSYFENRYQCKDGSYKWLAWTSMPVPAENATYTVARDITRRKRAEKAFRESEGKLHSILQNIPDIIFTINRDGTILTINQTRVPGREPEDVIGTKVYEYVNPEHRVILKDSIERVFQQGKPLEYEALGPDASGNYSAWYRTRMIPIKHDNQVTSVLQISTDITEQRKAADDLKKVHEQLEQRVLERTAELSNTNDQLKIEIKERKQIERERNTLIKELQETLAEIKTLGGLLPICSKCKKIRDDKGYWHQVESYVEKHSQAQFSHGLCEDCTGSLYSDTNWYKKKNK
jgi:PAS domain S-box-containing protein